MKQHNILNQPDNFTLVNTIYQCPAKSCDRTIVTYEKELDATRHMNGLPKTMLHAIVASCVVPLVFSMCDHHGGLPFRPDSDYANPELPGGMNHLIARVLLREPGITPRLVDGIWHELEAYDVNPRVLDGVIL